MPTAYDEVNMSKERELLNMWRCIAPFMIDPAYEKVRTLTDELLAQPEQEPVAWIIKEKETGYKTQVAYKPSVLKKGWIAIALYPEQSLEMGNE